MFDLTIYGFIAFGAFVIVGAGNAVNFTDGLDGLAIGPVMIAGATFGFIAYATGTPRFADYLLLTPTPGTAELAVVMGALVGGGLASSGTMRRLRRCSWATRDRWRWVGALARWRCA